MYVRTYVRMYVCMYVCMNICAHQAEWRGGPGGMSNVDANPQSQTDQEFKNPRKNTVSDCYKSDGFRV